MQQGTRTVLAASASVLLVVSWHVAFLEQPGREVPTSAHRASYVPSEVSELPVLGLDPSAGSNVPFQRRAQFDAGSSERSVSHSSAVAASSIPAQARLAYQRSAKILARAEPDCHLHWSLLAGIGRIESDHGRYGGNTLDSDGKARPGIFGIPLDGQGKTGRISDTDDGRWDHDSIWDRAVGPMQFIPSTWQVVASDGNDDGVRDPQNVHDAALAAGVYLCAGGHDLDTPSGARAAVFSYNHSRAYVDEVLALARAYKAGKSLTAIAVNDTPPPFNPGTPDQHAKKTRKKVQEDANKTPSKSHTVNQKNVQNNKRAQKKDPSQENNQNPATQTTSKPHTPEAAHQSDRAAPESSPSSSPQKTPPPVHEPVIICQKSESEDDTLIQCVTDDKTKIDAYRCRDSESGAHMTLGKPQEPPPDPVPECEYENPDNP